MFHNAHAYFASKLHNSTDGLLLVGSILPDLSVMGIIPWHDGLHGARNAQRFHKFVNTKYPAWLKLAQGVLAHNALDDTSHTRYKDGPGYAFQNTQKLAELVETFYGLDKQLAKGKAHNYIESAVDMLILKKEPKIQSQLKQALKNTDQNELANILAEFLTIDKSKLLASIKQFFDLFSRYNLVRLEEWHPFWSQLEKLFELKNIGQQHRKKLLEISLKTIKNTYREFLNSSLEISVKYT